MKTAKCRSIFVFVISLALFAACAVPAYAAAPDAEVEGLWLRAPDFPGDADVIEFEADGKGSVSFARSIDAGNLMLMILREPYPDDKVTPDSMKEMFLKNFTESGGDEDDVDFDSENSDFAELFGYPCATAEFKTGSDEDERECASVFVFTDEYLFTIAFTIASDYADYSGRVESWLKSMRFVNEEPEEGRGDLIEDEKADAEKGGEDEKESEKLVAVAYTAEDFGGVPWKISEPGEYDLWSGFGLPNDAICSIRVMPGYKATIYEHSEFGGNSESFDEDADTLGDWKRQASSLKVEKIGGADEDDAEEWLSETNEPGEFAESDLDEDDFASALKKQAKAIKKFGGLHEPHWYGETTDKERVGTGEELLKAFEALGYDVSEWTPNSFAQQVNNFFDWRKDLSVWQVACLVLNIDAGNFE